MGMAIKLKLIKTPPVAISRNKPELKNCVSEEDESSLVALSVFKHTSPQQFGKLMSLTKPRLAVGYHFQNDFDTLPYMLEEVRKVYDGPVVLAEDYNVFNITKDEMRVRESAVDEAIFPEPPTKAKLPVPPATEPPFSEFISAGAEMFPDVLGPIWDKINKENGTDHKIPQ